MEGYIKIKYTAQEILQILIDHYNYQTEFDIGVEKGKELTFNTTIGDWRDICDLLEPDKLAAYYHTLFELKTNNIELTELLQKEKQNLITFCDYIAQNAHREKISPIISMGKICYEAAIFKVLKDKLEKKGIDTKDFKPSAEFIPFFNEQMFDLVEIVSNLAPGTLSHYDIKSNIISKLGAITFLITIVVLIIALIIHKATLFLLIPLGIATLLFLIGNKFKPAKYEINGYHTIRDLIIGMKSKIESIS